MKYRDLKIIFSIEGVQFTILSICLEKLIHPIPKHNHSRNSYEIHYISYGYGTMITDGKQFAITPGSFVMTGPGVEHEQISDVNDPMTEYCIYLQVTPPSQPEKLSMMNTFLNQLFWIGKADTSIHNLIKQIFLEYETQKAGYELMLQTLLQQLIISMTRCYAADQDLPQKDDSLQTKASDLTYLIIEEAFLYDYKTLTLESLASLVNLGKRQTERLLQKHYNRTFIQKKTEARLSASCILLKETNKSISTIAEELGYSSQEHFANAFKSFYKMTPTVYRRN